MTFNPYQKAAYFAITGKQPGEEKNVEKPKMYALYENGVEVLRAATKDYGILVNKYNEKVKGGCRKYLLKIKPIQTQ